LRLRLRGGGLRLGELLALTLESIQQREEHWVIADLVGKGGHVRTVPIPRWVKFGGCVDDGRRHHGGPRLSRHQ
jgi:integrase